MKRILITIMLAISATLQLLSQNILLIGDSHVAGKIYPQTTKGILEQQYPTVSFDYYGIVGASYWTYSNQSKINLIAKRNPDVLIVSLGTNDCYSKRYNPTVHKRQIIKFCRMAQAAMPNVEIILTTPFDCGTKSNIHPNMPVCADAIRCVADSLDLKVFDLHARCGTCFIDQNLFQKDHVHLTRQGYKVLGKIVADCCAEGAMMELPKKQKQ